MPADSPRSGERGYKGLIKDPMQTPRLAVLCDFREEGWHSMDLSAEMLWQHLRAGHAGQVDAVRIVPEFRWRLPRQPRLVPAGLAFNVNRIWNRSWEYPRQLGKTQRDFDGFHVCDHSYAQLVHTLPPERTGVFCHDLDAFRCLLEPARERRPLWFRWLAKRILQGLQKAAVVFYSTAWVRAEIERHGLVDPQRLVHAPYGIGPEFQPAAPESLEHGLPAGVGPEPFLLHVGSCIPRKRVDVLLEVFAAVRSQTPELKLIQVGGTWTPEQTGQLDRLDLHGSVTQLRGLDRSAIAELYRHAALTLVTSEAEGFGLPVIEALACGSIVVSSDIPVLREVGGAALAYCRVADIARWSEVVSRFLSQPLAAPARNTRLATAARYSWDNQATIIADAYRKLLV